jgi:hypothetical protein
MEIQLTRSLAGVGARNEFLDIPAKDAHRLIDNGHAVPVEDAREDVGHSTPPPDTEAARLAADADPTGEHEAAAKSTANKSTARKGAAKR